MADPTLTIDLDALRTEMADRVALGRTWASVSAGNQSRITECLASALRMFYQANGRHRWSFMDVEGTLVLYPDIAVAAAVTVSGSYADPTTTLTASGGTPFLPAMVGREIVITGVGTYTISGYTSSTVIGLTGDASAASGATFSIDSGGKFRLPDNFEGISGPVVYQEGGIIRPAIRIVGAQDVWRRRQIAGGGYPEIAAILPADSGNANSVRHDLFVYPDVSAQVTVRFIYRPAGIALTSSLTVPYGAVPHGETIKAACFACLERDFQDRVDGPYMQQYERLLQKSIIQDSHLTRAELLGRMTTSESGSGLGGNGRRRGRSGDTYLFDGSQIGV